MDERIFIEIQLASSKRELSHYLKSSDFMTRLCAKKRLDDLENGLFFVD